MPSDHTLPDIHTVGVLGCGLMGSGIAQSTACAGYKTLVLEIDQARLDKGLARVRRSLEQGIEKGKLTAAQGDATLANLSGTTSFADLASCDFVIEAVVESLAEKRDAYHKLEALVGPETIFATNTSSLCVTELAAATLRPDRFVGLHFFNPVPAMKLVEVVRALTTSDTTAAVATTLARALGKEPINAPDRPGFIVNRLLVPYLLDAIRAYEHGLGTVEDIDKGMSLGCGYPMGPFTLLDFVGLDTTYYIANIMFDELREAVYAPPPLLKRMVAAGWLGRKSGRGILYLRVAATGRRCRTSASRWTTRDSASLQRREHRLRLGLPLAVLGRPLGIEGCVEHLLERPPRLVLLPHVGQGLGEEEQACGAPRVVGERLAQVLDGLLVAAAEEPGYLEIPSAQRAVGGALLERGIEPEHRFERLPNRLPVFDALAHAERLGQPAHVRGQPEVPRGSSRVDADGYARRLDARLQIGPASARGPVRAQPI